MIKVGIVGGGWPGMAHARGYLAAGGFSIVAVSDLIPERADTLKALSPKARVLADARDVVRDPEVQAVSLCVPTDLHAPLATQALKAGKHVIVESPPGIGAREARSMLAAAQKSGNVLTYGFQRRFGGFELAAQQAIEKQYIGEPQHVRATWTRTRGVPVGTGWYADKSKSGGGVVVDLGLHMIDLAYHLIGRPTPATVFAVTRPGPGDVEDFATALIKFDGGKTLELSTAWSINQPPSQNGTSCRVHGSTGAVEVYTPKGPVLHRHFDAKGNSKAVELKLPKITGHAAMLRQFKEAIAGRPSTIVTPEQGVVLMNVVEAIYKSAETGRSAEVRRTSNEQANIIPEPVAGNE